MAERIGRTIIAPTMAETLSCSDVLGQSSGLLSSVVRPLEERTVGLGRLRWTSAACWKGASVIWYTPAVSLTLEQCWCSRACCAERWPSG